MSTRVAVIGVGALGQHHARILAGMPDVELTAVVDARAEQGQAVAERLGTDFLSTIDEVLDRVDCVSIAVPTDYHRNVAEQFLLSRIPVMVEKPLAANLNDAQHLVKVADARNTLLQVGHIERFNPAFTSASELIKNPKYIRCERVSPFSFRSTDIGVIHDLMIHDLDLALDLVDSEVKEVTAFGANVMGTLEDAVQARLRFRNGCIVDFTASRISPAAHRTMQVWSESGCTTIDFTSRHVAHYAPSDQLLHGVSPVEQAACSTTSVEKLKQEVFGKIITRHEPDCSDEDALTAELTEFIECVRTGSDPRVDGHTALKALRVAARIQTSVDNHEWDGTPTGRVGPELFRWTSNRIAG